MTAPIVPLDDVIGDLRRLVESESYSDDPDGLRGCARILAGLVEGYLGGHATIGADARVSWRSPGDGAPVLVLGHLDTVWPPGTVERKPFRIEDGRITGPGVFDMKGGLVVVLHALAALRRRGRMPRIELLVTSDEETGSQRSRDAIEEAAARSGRVLVPEPCGTDGAVKRARKGVAMGTVTVTGRASHAGLAPHEGVNAAVGLGALLTDIVALGDPDRGTSVVPTVLRGGSTTNTVPAEASTRLDVRFLDPGEVERVRRELAELQPPNGASLAVELEPNRPPLTHGASEPLVGALREAAAAVGQEIGAETSGGASDGNFAAAAGAYVLDGLGPPGRDPHAETEHVLVDGLLPRVQLLTELIPRVAAVDPPA